MFKNVHSVFLLLVFTQASHSIEEYIGHLWEVLPPARFLCSLVSDNLEKGFLVINIGFFIFGFLAWLFLVRTGHVLARYVIWFWIIIELINGMLHVVWAILETSYRPGLITAPFLFAIAWYLKGLMIKSSDDGMVHSGES